MSEQRLGFGVNACLNVCRRFLYFMLFFFGVAEALSAIALTHSLPSLPPSPPSHPSLYSHLALTVLRE